MWPIDGTTSARRSPFGAFRWLRCGASLRAWSGLETVTNTRVGSVEHPTKEHQVVLVERKEAGPRSPRSGQSDFHDGQPVWLGVTHLLAALCGPSAAAAC